MPPFDTVKELKSWLSEEPDVAEVESNLKAEQEGPARKTAISALERYLDEHEPEDDSDGRDNISGDTTFRVTGEIDGYARGEQVHLDPDHPTVQQWRSDGRINRWLS